LFGNLRAGLRTSHHEHGAGPELLRIAIGVRVDLPDVSREIGCERRDLRLLIQARGDYHVPGQNRGALLARHKVTSPPCIPFYAARAEIIEDGQIKALRVPLEICNDFAPRHETVRIIALILSARQLRLPVRSVEGERIPAMAAPSIAWPVRPLQNE